jgi:hypothetical protein
MNINITVPDLDVIAAFRVGANPGFVHYGSPLAAKI